MKKFHQISSCTAVICILSTGFCSQIHKREIVFKRYLTSGCTSDKWCCWLLQRCATSSVSVYRFDLVTDLHCRRSFDIHGCPLTMLVRLHHPAMYDCSSHRSPALRAAGRLTVALSKPQPIRLFVRRVVVISSSRWCCSETEQVTSTLFQVAWPLTVASKRLFMDR